MRGIPPAPLWLGLSGLLPQFAAAGVLVAGPEEWRYAALALAWGYAALIFSFLGGLWWGLAARDGGAVKSWVWIASVLPSLIAFASYAPWVFGLSWPEPSLIVLGILIAASPLIDRQLAHLTPDWWMTLRWTLSLGLGGATLVAATI